MWGDWTPEDPVPEGRIGVTKELTVEEETDNNGNVHMKKDKDGEIKKD